MPSMETLMMIWALGQVLAICSVFSTMVFTNRPLVGILMIRGRETLYIPEMISTMSRRRNGSPPLKVIQYGLLPTLRKIFVYSSTLRLSAFFFQMRQVLQRELHVYRRLTV